MALADSFASQLSASQTVSDGIVALVYVTLDGTDYIGVVMNTEGRQISEYQNWNFNSFTKIGDTYYGAKDDGIYKLEGDTDQGQEIAMYVKTGKSDFGSDQLKSMHKAYLGYSSDGDVWLKVISSERGTLQETWYELSSEFSDTQPDNGSIPVGSGLRSRYWQFELVNRGGADVKITDITLMPIVLKRRQ
jgi:hypothetical protein